MYESHALQAAVACLGAALLSLTLVQDELDRGLLERPFGPVVAGLTYHLVEADGQAPVARVKAARDWLLAEISSISEGGNMVNVWGRRELRLPPPGSLPDREGVV